MAPKTKGGGKKKAKDPPFDASPAALAEFGLKPNELVRTPLGIQVTVIGVKRDKAGPGQVWVRCANGSEAPLEGCNSAAALGFRRCAQAEHIRRDVLQSELELQKLEEQRLVVEEVLRLKAQGLPIPEHLLPPPPKPEPKKKDAKKK